MSADDKGTSTVTSECSNWQVSNKTGGLFTIIPTCVKEHISAETTDTTSQC